MYLLISSLFSSDLDLIRDKVASGSPTSAALPRQRALRGAHPWPDLKVVALEVDLNSPATPKLERGGGPLRHFSEVLLALLLPLFELPLSLSLVFGPGRAHLHFAAFRTRKKVSSGSAVASETPRGGPDICMRASWAAVALQPW